MSNGRDQEVCINCCGVNAYVENGKLVKVEGMPEHWLNKGALCQKGQRLPDLEAEIHPAAAAKYGVVHGELIAVETPRGSIKIKANVTPDIKQGVVSVPHGWAKANCNILLDAKLLDRVSGDITMNSVACRVISRLRPLGLELLCITHRSFEPGLGGGELQEFTTMGEVEPHDSRSWTETIAPRFMCS